MKKILLMAFFCLCMAVGASAQYKEYYSLEQEGMEYPNIGIFRIDWNNKLYFLDSDSEDETRGQIKNYKESGNKKTFDVWYPEGTGYTGKLYSIEFTTLEEHKFKLVHILADTGYKQVYTVSDKKPLKSKSQGNSDPKTSLTDKVKNSVGNGIKKGLNAIKKKK